MSEITAKFSETLSTALMNAVKPNYDFNYHCGRCGNQGKDNNGEWLLWCGEKEHAQALLTAAAIVREVIEVVKEPMPLMDHEKDSDNKKVWCDGHEWLREQIIRAIQIKIVAATGGRGDE